MHGLLDSDGKEVREEVEAAPKMADSWVKIISVTGPLGAIAIYMIWSFTTTMAADVRGLNTAMPLHVQATERLNMTNKEILEVLKAMCVNAAKTSNERSNCFSR